MEPATVSDGEKNVLSKSDSVPAEGDHDVGMVEDVMKYHLERKLSWRQMQLMIIGGSIGTALFVSIGAGLISSGPAGMFIGFIIYSIFMAFVNNCMAEMAVYMPISGGWIRMASHWADDALGFTFGWNFFLYEALLIPYEISAFNLILTFWSDSVPPAAICIACIVAYGLINIFAVHIYGESEFWLAAGKLILIIICICFTIVSMAGGNPHHDAFGFRYWGNPGAFVAYIHQGSLGRFEGILAGIWRAAFTIVGPEYVAMLAAEAKAPRKNLKKAFKTIYWRFAIFFIGCALCVGILLPYNDPTLVAINTGEQGGSGTGAASPFVIAMQNLGITILPDITNALLLTSIFSAGNSYVYCASRTLYSLSLDGHAPKIFSKCLKSGVPIYAFALTMIFPFLSLLILGSNSSQVVLWLANLVTGGQILNFVGIATTYLFFYRAMKAQGFDRDTLPYKGWFQPYGAWIAVISMTFVVLLYGYTVFLPGYWSVGDFFIYYCMVLVVIVLYLGWKIIKRTKVIPATEVDLIWEAPSIDAYEAATAHEEHDVSVFQSITRKLRSKSENAV